MSRVCYDSSIPAKYANRGNVKVTLQLLSVLAVTVLADAQARPSTAPQSTIAKTKAKPVLVITGSCPDKARSGCRLMLDQQAFERMVMVVNPRLPANQRRNVAATYLQLYVLANHARAQGMDKDPSFQVRLQLEELKALASLYADELQKGLKPSEKEVEIFYYQNRVRMEELQLHAVVVSKMIAKEPRPEESKSLASQLRARAAAGENMDKLQQEATVAAGAPGPPPSTDLGWRARGRLGAHESELAALGDGRVSNVLEDAQNFYIYKVDSRRPIPLATAKLEIENTMVRERFKEKLAELLKQARMNLDPEYFPMSDQPSSVSPQH